MRFYRNKHRISRNKVSAIKQRGLGLPRSLCLCFCFHGNPAEMQLKAEETEGPFRSKVQPWLFAQSRKICANTAFTRKGGLGKSRGYPCIRRWSAKHQHPPRTSPAPTCSVGSTPIRVNLTQRAPTSTAIRGGLTRFKLGDSLFKKSWILGGKGERKFESTWTQIWIKHWKNIWDFRENHSPREGLVVNFVLTLHLFPTILP